MKRSVAAILVAVGLAACGGTGGGSGGQQLENQQQNQDQQSLLLAQPLPHYNYSQLRQNVKEIENAQAKGVQTTTFFFNLGERDPQQSCPSIGAPIASTTQLSNPQKSQWNYSGDSGIASAVIGNQEPTGVYTGDSSGTYILCVGSDGKPYANYWEGFVQTVFAPAKWNYSTHSVQLIGPASYHFSGIK